MRGIARVALVVALSMSSAACRAEDEESPPAPSSRTQPGMDMSLRDAALRVIEQREQALVGGDRELFLATVDEDFAETQARWFDNLAKLPVTDLELSLGNEGIMSTVRGEGALQLPVELTMRLEGFDRKPVTELMIYTFDRDGDEAVLASDRNTTYDFKNRWVPAPWDVTSIEVLRRGPILGIFDEGTEPDAEAIMAELADARVVVRDAVPTWPGRVVAYAIEDEQAFETLTSFMESTQAGAIAFPVLARPGASQIASLRFAFNPAFTGSPVSRDSVVRHELVHVALGGSDVSSPVWLREGTAEQISRSVLPVAERKLRSAIVLGSAPGMAQDVRLEPGWNFYRGQVELNYELATVTCDYLATTRGPRILTELMHAFAATPATTPAQVNAVVRRVTGLAVDELGTQARDWAAQAR